MALKFFGNAPHFDVINAPKNIFEFKKGSPFAEEKVKVDFNFDKSRVESITAPNDRSFYSTFHINRHDWNVEDVPVLGLEKRMTDAELKLYNYQTENGTVNKLEILKLEKEGAGSIQDIQQRFESADDEYSKGLKKVRELFNAETAEHKNNFHVQDNAARKAEKSTKILEENRKEAKANIRKPPPPIVVRPVRDTNHGSATAGAVVSPERETKPRENNTPPNDSPNTQETGTFYNPEKVSRINILLTKNDEYDSMNPDDIKTVKQLFNNLQIPVENTKTVKGFREKLNSYIKPPTQFAGMKIGKAILGSPPEKLSSALKAAAKSSHK